MQACFKAVFGCFLLVFCHSICVGQALGPQQPNNPQYNQQQTQNSAQQGQAIAGGTSATNVGLVQAEPQLPEGFPLTPELNQWVDQLLVAWETNSNEVKSYRCDFKRWHYMPRLLMYRDADNKLAARMVTKGEIRFAKPDRGRYDVTEVWHFNAPQKEGDEPFYDLNPEVAARETEKERWICDGKAIYEFDFSQKRLNEMKLPPEMQGEGLKNSPLPFVFGAKADDMKKRFWIRPMSPDGLPEGYYMIEAYPKTSRDARAYSKVQIVLSSEPFLPVRVELFAANYDIKENPDSMVLVFENRTINDPRHLIQRAIDDLFTRPLTPVGWDFSSIDLANEDDGRSAQNAGNIK